MITTLFGVFRGNHECLARLVNARESVGQGPFFNRTTQPKQVILTRRNGFDSHILKSENQVTKKNINNAMYT